MFKNIILSLTLNFRMILARLFVVLAFTTAACSMWLNAGPTWTWVPSIFYIMTAIYFVLTDINRKSSKRVV